jgi:hypothetical protein
MNHPKRTIIFACLIAAAALLPQRAAAQANGLDAGDAQDE